MTIVGCTGHQTLSPSTDDDVRGCIDRILQRYSSATLIGLTNLAAGADQVFARAVLAAGARLHVVIPCTNYMTTFTTNEDRAAYTHLLQSAHEHLQLAYPEPSEEAFMAGGRRVVDGCDLLLAVWDGRPAGGLGGTADVVAYAENQGKPVTVIWPEGAARR